METTLEDLLVQRRQAMKCKMSTGNEYVTSFKATCGKEASDITGRENLLVFLLLCKPCCRDKSTKDITLRMENKTASKNKQALLFWIILHVLQPQDFHVPPGWAFVHTIDCVGNANINIKEDTKDNMLLYYVRMITLLVHKHSDVTSF